MSNVASPILSPTQLAVCQLLCAGGRSGPGPIRAATRAGPNTLATLVGLGLVTKTSAGGRGVLYHLTPVGRELVCAAANEPETEGGPTAMTESILATTDESPTAAPVVDAPAASKKRSGKKAAEMATTAAGDSGPATPAAKKATGPTPETKALYKATVTAIKAAAGRGAKTVEKLKYMRVGDAKGKTVAYVNFPTSKSVLVEIPRHGATGYDTVSVKGDGDVAVAVVGVTAFIAARDAASKES